MVTGSSLSRPSPSGPSDTESSLARPFASEPAAPSGSHDGGSTRWSTRPPPEVFYETRLSPMGGIALVRGVWPSDWLPNRLLLRLRHGSRRCVPRTGCHLTVILSCLRGISRLRGIHGLRPFLGLVQGVGVGTIQRLGVAGYCHHAVTGR